MERVPSVTVLEDMGTPERRADLQDSRCVVVPSTLDDGGGNIRVKDASALSAAPERTCIHARRPTLRRYFVIRFEDCSRFQTLLVHRTLSSPNTFPSCDYGRLDQIAT